MQIYWTLKSVPELSGLPTDDERRRVWRDAYREMTRRSWQFWVSVALFGGCPQIGEMLIGHRPLGNVVGIIVGGFIWAQILRHLARPYIRATLLSDERAEERRHRPISGQELLTAALVVPVLVVLILLVSYALRGFPAPVFPAPVLDRELVRLF